MWFLFLFFGNADELLAVRICRELLSSTTTAKQSVLLRQDSPKVHVQIHHPSSHSYWRVSWPHGTCGHLQPFQLLVSFQHLGNGCRFINCKPILMFNISWSAIELIEAQPVTAVYRSVCLGEKTVKIYLDMVFFPKCIYGFQSEVLKSMEVVWKILYMSKERLFISLKNKKTMHFFFILLWHVSCTLSQVSLKADVLL